MTELNISHEIKRTLESQKRSVAWLARETDEYYKTMHDKLKFDRFTDVYLLFKVSKLLNIDLNELRDRL
jgi:hypothetical protein